MKGWDPEKKELVGEATAKPSGQARHRRSRRAASSGHGKDETFNVEPSDLEQGRGEASSPKAGLMEASLGYVTGRSRDAGNAKFDLGQVISVDVDDVRSKDPFIGKYYVMGVSHRYVRAEQGRLRRVLRLARDAQDE